MLLQVSWIKKGTGTFLKGDCPLLKFPIYLSLHLPTLQHFFQSSPIQNPLPPSQWQNLRVLIFFSPTKKRAKNSACNLSPSANLLNAQWSGLNNMDIYNGGGEKCPSASLPAGPLRQRTIKIRLLAGLRAPSI